MCSYMSSDHTYSCSLLKTFSTDVLMSVGASSYAVFLQCTTIRRKVASRWEEVLPSFRAIAGQYGQQQPARAAAYSGQAAAAPSYGSIQGTVGYGAASATGAGAGYASQQGYGAAQGGGQAGTNHQQVCASASLSDLGLTRFSAGARCSCTVVDAMEQCQISPI